MARLRTVLGAVRKAAARDAKAIRTVSSNNLFYAGLTLLFMTDAPAMVFVITMMALVLFLPSSGDPLAHIPPDRLKLWPLTPKERLWLRLISPWLNPLTWLILAGLVWRGMTLGLWAIVAGVFTAGFLGSWRGQPRLRWIPGIPGPWKELVRKDLRQVLTALDFYCALLISLGAFLSRMMGKLPGDAFAPLTLVILVMISTCAQTLFGLDGEAGMTRYALMPIRTWKVLTAKGMAFCLVAAALTAPLSPVAGITGALAALTAGNHISLDQRRPQQRWRFRASGSYGASVGVMIPMILASAATLRWTWLAPAAGCLMYAASLWWCDRRSAAKAPN